MELPVNEHRGVRPLRGGAPGLTKRGLLTHTRRTVDVGVTRLEQTPDIHEFRGLLASTECMEYA